MDENNNVIIELFIIILLSPPHLSWVKGWICVSLSASAGICHTACEDQSVDSGFSDKEQERSIGYEQLSVRV